MPPIALTLDELIYANEKLRVRSKESMGMPSELLSETLLLIKNLHQRILANPTSFDCGNGMFQKVVFFYFYAGKFYLKRRHIDSYKFLENASNLINASPENCQIIPEVYYYLCKGYYYGRSFPRHDPDHKKAAEFAEKYFLAYDEVSVNDRMLIINERFRRTYYFAKLIFVITSEESDISCCRRFIGEAEVFFQRMENTSDNRMARNKLSTLLERAKTKIANIQEESIEDSFENPQEICSHAFPAFS